MAQAIHTASAAPHVGAIFSDSGIPDHKRWDRAGPGDLNAAAHGTHGTHCNVEPASTPVLAVRLAADAPPTAAIAPDSTSCPLPAAIGPPILLRSRAFLQVFRN